MTDFSQALNELCDCEYPASIEDIRAKCENNNVTLADGSTTTLGEILDTIENPPDKFQSDNELRNFLMSLAPKGGVGRQNYDDRSPNLYNDRTQHSI